MAEGPDTSLAPIGSVHRTKVGREATEPMREDIRLLGTILGDTVRDQNGEVVFDLVERARVESFRVRRSEIDRAEVHLLRGRLLLGRAEFDRDARAALKSEAFSECRAAAHLEVHRHQRRRRRGQGGNLVRRQDADRLRERPARPVPRSGRLHLLVQGRVREAGAHAAQRQEVHHASLTHLPCKTGRQWD